MLSEREIREYLKEKYPEFACGPLNILGETDSTNHRAKALAEQGAFHGTVVTADSQRTGRGRLGRSFFSPSGGGLYFSIILKSGFDMSRGGLVTAMAAVAAARAISVVYGLETGIKWVNDLYLEGKKVCGILAESVPNLEGGFSAVVVGIGINIKTPEDGFPEDIREKAIALDAVRGAAGGDINRLAGELIYNIMTMAEAVEEGKNDICTYFMEEYRNRSIVIGRYIKVIQPGKPERKAFASGITDDGGLMVTLEDGGEEILLTGEISILL